MAKHVTQVELKKMFNRLNKQYFDGKIDATVQFADLDDDDGIFGGGAIEISKSLRISYPFVEITLLHEMIHAQLGATYTGSVNHGGHGMRFQARILELIYQGAYDDLL